MYIAFYIEFANQNSGHLGTNMLGPHPAIS